MHDWPQLGFGIALKTGHYRHFLQEKPRADWLEAHSENYLASGGYDVHVLERLRADYPISLHGIGLGLGSARGYSLDHLHQLAQLEARIQPALMSDHLCWGALADRNLNDLLPISYTKPMLDLICERVAQAQDILKRRILLENVSAYVRYPDACSEAMFLAEVVRRTGCGVLLDVNNLYVNQRNHGEDPHAAIAALPLGSVGEIHLAGHFVRDDVVIDDHGSAVIDPVWDLYRAALARFGPVSSMIEWDTNVPELEVLLAQADLARSHAAEVLRVSGAGASSAPELAPADIAAQQQRFGLALFQHDQGTLADDFRMPPENENFSAEDLRRRRFAVYRGNLHGHWKLALGLMYPVLKKLLGDTFFTGLTREYGAAALSQSPDLNQFGLRFPHFVQECELLRDYPYMPDLARLESALHQGYYAADGAPLDPAVLAQVQPEQLDHMHFQLQPACCLLRSDWPVFKIWQAHQQEPVEDFSTDPEPCHVLIVRPQWFCRILSLTPASYAALQALQDGQSLGQALDLALEIDEDYPFVTELQQWLQYGVLRMPA
ncbi:DUF692 family multinuclear iron-containing protein [Massilia sp. W12]|uniref:MNIO family bufferin maturase n=1 Tax=Massilia sp. W12 TaxID=3126507 RepID=UPI0030D602A7